MSCGDYSDIEKYSSNEPVNNASSLNTTHDSGNNACEEITPAKSFSSLFSLVHLDDSDSSAANIQEDDEENLDVSLSSLGLDFV